MAATVLLEMRTDLLSAADLATIERLLRESLTWALVDGLAVDVVGAVLAADPDRTRPVLDRWSTDDDFWIRRSALLAWLRPLRHGAPLDRFLRLRRRDARREGVLHPQGHRLGASRCRQTPAD